MVFTVFASWMSPVLPIAPILSIFAPAGSPKKSRWKDGQTRDVQADMMRLTLEIVARTLFAAEIGSDSAGASAAMETLMHTSMKRMGRLIPVPAWSPLH